MFEATAPHKSDSNAPKAVMVNAGARKLDKFDQSKVNGLKRSLSSNVWGMTPICGTCHLNKTVASVAAIKPSSDAGKRAFSFFGQKIMVKMTISPSKIACQLSVNPSLKYSSSLNSAASVAAVLTPSKLSIWPMAIISAIPEVKPVMTAEGINAMKRPNLKRPISSRKKPDSRPAIQTPSNP